MGSYTNLGDVDDGREMKKLFPHYVCHKTVWAAKVIAVWDRLLGGCIVRVQLPEEDGPDEYIEFGVGPDWREKHNPERGGYIVAYDDGYVSFSPAHAFEGGYSRPQDIEDGSPA